MSRIQAFQVFPTIPEPLLFLETLARNMWWCWNQEAKELFRRIDLKAWESSGRNPLVFVTLVSQERLEELAGNEGFLEHLSHVKELFEEQTGGPSGHDFPRIGENEVIGYFSMEFGIHESLPLFAGGLGILAGDHLKAASCLNLPLVGVGLLYCEGYFRQYLDHNGWQQEEYPRTNLYHLPVERVRDASGNDLRISLAGPKGTIMADVWKIMVGCVPLILLDTNIHENPSEIRGITSRLYAGDDEVRLAQEMLLGIGGMRALAAMGLFPKVCHMNEGHSAFASIERLALAMANFNLDLPAALEVVPRTAVFTTHTPVAAGHEEFPAHMVRPYLAPYQEPLGLSVDQMLAWGQPEGAGADAPFSLFLLGLKMAQYYNGVSRLHGKVARRMWNHVWPQRSENEVPIGHITNGVHIPSFVSTEFAHLFKTYLGPKWYLGSREPANIRNIDEIYDADLWSAHVRNRARLVRTSRQQMRKQYERRNAPLATIEAVVSVLDPDILTVGFARRFATYKRATLLLRDPGRLEAMIRSTDRPVQFIFAGKAHPRDGEGKELIQKVVQFATSTGLRDRFVFLENYDMHLARHLVQGADVWLNTPRRPFEACGTSGMKAAINGVPNLSIMDGWWCEGYSEETGWAIGHGEDYEDPDYQDEVESRALYNILENDVIPCFYERRNGEAPSCWIKKMKASIKMAMADYCSFRMVADYRDRYYRPAAEWSDVLVADEGAEARKLAVKIARLRSLWGNIHIDPPERERRGSFKVGDTFRLTTVVTLGALTPDEVDVELYYGPLKSVDVFESSLVEPMGVSRELGGGQYEYACDLTCLNAGRFGYTARVNPRGDHRIKYTPRLVTWA